MAKGVAVKIGEYQTHPAADLFPLLEGDEFNALCKSIIERGLEKPIELYEGRVIDGRNRLRACLQMSAEPEFIEWAGGDPYEYVWAHNAVRRHLDAGQRAAIRLKFDDEIRALAEKRREEANAARGRTQRVGAVAPTSKATVPSTCDTRDELARRADVGSRTAQKALTVQKHAPELADKVASGEVKLGVAYQAAKERKRRKANQRLPGKKHAPPPRHTKAPSDELTKAMADAIHTALAKWPKGEQLTAGIAVLERELARWRSHEELRKGPCAA
jgi:hypothetical protein